MSTTDQQSIAIRQATAKDVRACRMLLPAISASSALPGFLVAEEPQTTRIVGAIGFLLSTDSNRPIFRVDIHVVPPFRRRGIGKSLVHSLEHQASAAGLHALDAFPPIVADSTEESIWRTFGFERFKTIFEFEAELIDIHNATRPLLDRVRAKNRIPADAKLIPLCDASHDELIRFHMEHLGGSAPALADRMTRTDPDAFDQEVSFALMVGGKLMAASFGSPTEDPLVCVENAVIVHPSLRKSWAHLWMLNEQSIRGIQQRTYRRVRFTTFAKNGGERLVGPQVPLKLISARAWMRRSLSAAPAVDAEA